MSQAPPTREIRKTPRRTRKSAKVFPINRLPDHILADILILVPRREDPYRPTVAHVLCDVCQHWRRIALSTPKLWDFVSLSCNSHQMAAHITRSQHVPIDVSFDFREHNGVGSTYSLVLNGCMTLLGRAWSRVRTLSLHLWHPVQVNLIAEAFNDETRLAVGCGLESFYVSMAPGLCNHRSHNNRFGEADISLPLPMSQKLQAATFRGIHCFPKNFNPTATFGGLVELHIESAGPIPLSNGLFRLLQFTPNLIRLAILKCTIEQSDSAATVLLTALRELVLGDINNTACVNTILQSIDAPNLRSMVFSSTLELSNGVTIDWKAVSRYRTLDKIELGGFMGVYTSLILDGLGSLENLQMILLFRCDDFSGGNNLPRALTDKLLDPNYCPKLINLRVFYKVRSSTHRAFESLKTTRPLLLADVLLDDSLNTCGSDDSTDSE